MSSCSNAPEVESISHENTLPDMTNLSECCGSPLEPKEDEDEDEDVDFNPFLKETLSLEASSSLSSEVEGLDANAFGNRGNSFKFVCINSSVLIGEVQDCAVGESEHSEENIVMQTTDSLGGPYVNESQKTVPRKPRKRKSAVTSQQETGPVRESENGLSSGIGVNDVIVGELSNTMHSQKPTMELDDSDAICMRTRARYSLASFTLDELETFLQETDDEDDLQNVDDEEEYRKFLAAVLCGDGDSQTIQGNKNIDDEDEDNDADFEIEIEEALESDLDENTRNKSEKEKYERAGRRPQTRQNRRQKTSSQSKNKHCEQVKRPLRPLLPIMPNGRIAALPTLDGKSLMPENPSSCLPSTAEDGLSNGFSLHQIGQLYCLIHEHVQLLIQVFSLCVLDPSRQHIATQVQGLIFEMLHRCDQVSRYRSEPYPGYCLRPPYIHPSVEFTKFSPAQCTFESSPTFDAHRDGSLPNNEMPASHNISSSKERCEYVFDEQSGSFQTTEDYFWVPHIRRPLLSILDVAPLNLVGRYMDDVSTAVCEYRQQHLQSTCDTPFEREPLFPLPSFFSLAEANGEVFGETILPAANTVPSSPSQQPPKMTLAAALVERTKKQPVALVPKQIVKLSQRFLPLFNPALYPHKPPPVTVANRVLFTDSEDELLALGLMEYNTDWKAIQQRFLPCKSKHQIFVRQKNRCSSKAPENPIKAVRRMKTSPLTEEEVSRIQEGLKVFKLDWMSVWKFVVPHRDPSLLPRQWRIALGTQRSYKHNASQKEKRRLYESSRRKCKAAELASRHTVSEKEEAYQTGNAGREKNSGDDYRDNEAEAYVHEAFLADCRQGTSIPVSTELPSSGCRVKNLPSNTLSQEGAHTREQPNTCGSGEAQPQNGYIHEFPGALMYSQHMHTLAHLNQARHCELNTKEPNFANSGTTLNTSKSQFCWRPYRARKTNNACLVKLAPELPPVNLPSSVRVISESAFKSYHCGVSTKVSDAGGGNSGANIEKTVPLLPRIAKSGTTHPLRARRSKINPLKENVTNLHPEESRVVKDNCTAEERAAESDLQMHPLLFKAPEDGSLPYYPLNCSTSTPSSFSFFSGNQPQLTLSLFHSPYQASSAVNCFNKSLKESSSTSPAIDFHPLLQRTDDINSDLVTACSTGHPSAGLESFRGKSNQLQNPSDAAKMESRVSCGPSATSTIPPSPNERTNELDLEIHLSSTSRNDKATGSKDGTAHNLMKSTVSAPDSGGTMETQMTSSPCYHQGESCPAVSSKLLPGHSLVKPSNNIKGYCMDDIGDQSHPEIVMEKEELSDSDEEIEEHVEFECEEMADSEGEEGSDCEHIAEMQNKEASSLAMEKVVSDADFDDQQCESRTDCHPQGDVLIPRKGCSPYVKLGLTSRRKDTTSSSSWLSLDLRAQGHPLHTKPKHIEGIISEGPAAKILASSRPNRSCKKTMPSTNKVIAQEHAVDVLQQLSLGPFAVPSLRKPGKRACRTNTSMSMGMTTESFSSDGKDKVG